MLDPLPSDPVILYQIASCLRAVRYLHEEQGVTLAILTVCWPWASYPGDLAKFRSFSLAMALAAAFYVSHLIPDMLVGQMEVPPFCPGRSALPCLGAGPGPVRPGSSS
jgi:hypothetical protein